MYTAYCPVLGASHQYVDKMYHLTGDSGCQTKSQAKCQVNCQTMIKHKQSNLNSDSFRTYSYSAKTKIASTPEKFSKYPYDIVVDWLIDEEVWRFCEPMSDTWYLKGN